MPAFVLPIVTAIVDPLPHYGVIRVQVNGNVFVFWIEHIAKFLQSAVFWGATGGVTQVVHNVRDEHFTCKMKVAQRHLKEIFSHLWIL